MKKLIYSFFALVLIGCKGGGSETAAITAPVEEDPEETVTWVELSSACQEIVEDYLWARYSSVTDKIYIFEETGGCIADNLANPKLSQDTCGVRSHFSYGSYDLCHSGDLTGLTNVNNAWLSIEEIEE